MLEPHRERITWDAVIHSVGDIDALPFPPRVLNSKPSRFGSLRGLLDFYDACAERGIGLYGGGQFELGPGRGQIQYLASLFHPGAPNDVAPGGYNLVPPPDGAAGQSAARQARSRSGSAGCRRSRTGVALGVRCPDTSIRAWTRTSASGNGGGRRSAGGGGGASRR